MSCGKHRLNQAKQTPCFFKGGLLLVGLLLLGCSSSVSKASNPAPSLTPQASDSSASDSSTVELSMAQQLPVTAQVKVADQMIQLEVAQTASQQSMGLMYRTQLDANRGMLFPFNPARAVTFWMKNVAIPLDMVFLRNGRVLSIASNVPPCAKEPCPVYGPPSIPVDQVIELRGGRAAELGIKPGDRLTVEALTN